MKILLTANTPLLIRKIDSEHAQWLIELLRRKSAKFGYWNSGDDVKADTISIRLSEDQEIDFSDEEEAKIVLNTIDAHVSVRVKYIYMGNLKFNILVDK